jgi:hypothetical protein
MTLLECIHKAKAANANFVTPEKPLETMNIDELTDIGIHEFLKNDLLVYAAIVVLKQHVVLKAFLKATLKDFILKYSTSA